MHILEDEILPLEDLKCTIKGASLGTLQKGRVMKTGRNNRESNAFMNNAQAGKRPSRTTAHFVGNTMPSN